MRRSRALIVPILIVGIPFLIYLLHALTFGAWIVDDAAITFAYSRSFAQGFGLVSQPGMPPVEGYSNTAWLLLIAPFFALNSFDPVITPKLISLLLVGGSFFAIYNTLRGLAGRGWVVFAALLLAAVNTSFVAWTISGLENPLYLLLVCLMLWQTVRIVTRRSFSARNAALLGLIAALTGMTRPDGLAYVLTLPAILIPARRRGWRRKGGLLLAYGAAFAAAYGGFIAFRLAYFGAPLPNTYYMKGGPGLEELIALLTLQPEATERIIDLLQGIFGSLKDVVLVLLGVLSLYVVIARRWTEQAWAIFVFLLGSVAVYVLLPPDWMGEYRFATVFILLIYLYSALIIETVLRRLPRRWYTAAAAALTVLAVFSSVQLFAPRSEAFQRDPTVPIQYVKAAFADRFDGFEQALGLEDASVLLPDVGGMLYYSDLTVYDLAGLTDRTIAQTLGMNIFRPAFHDYVFETITPTFIHTHGFWTYLARLELDPRFAEMYVPICAYNDPWVRQSYGIDRLSGDFVLRSVADAHVDELERIRAELDENCDLK